MAQSVNQIKSQYPLPAYNYRVTILLAGEATVIGCSQVNGLDMAVETATYQHGLSFLTGEHIMPGRRQAVQLSILKGIMANGAYLSDWMGLNYPTAAPGPAGLIRKRDLLVDLCDEAGLPVVRWTVAKAMPTRLEGPRFDANTNEVAFERLELIAHELQVDYNP